MSRGIAAEPVAGKRLDHAQLLVFRGSDGQPNPVKTIADWEKRRAEILAGMQKVMGPLPGPEKRCPLQIELQDEKDCGSYVRRAIIFRPEPKSIIPAYLLIPKTALKGNQPAPGVLCLHPTDDKIGNKTVVGLGGAPHRAYAAELAERGFVTIAPAYPLLANYQPDLKALGYQSGTMKAIWDNIRALDLLDALPFVRHGKYGAIGHSLGGHNSLFTAVFDPRIQVVVSSCGFDSFLDYMDGHIKGWTSERYMPQLLQYPLAEIPFDFYEVIAAIAPRTCYVSAPFNDTNFKWRSVYKIEQAAQPVYQLHGAHSRLIVEHPNCEHDFPDEIREKAYRVLAQALE